MSPDSDGGVLPTIRESQVKYSDALSHLDDDVRDRVLEDDLVGELLAVRQVTDGLDGRLREHGHADSEDWLTMQELTEDLDEIIRSVLEDATERARREVDAED
jgi:hypothetical protein